MLFMTGARHRHFACWSRSRLADRRTGGGWSDSLHSLQHPKCKPSCTSCTDEQGALLLCLSAYAAWQAWLHATPASGLLCTLRSKLAWGPGDIFATIVCNNMPSTVPTVRGVEGPWIETTDQHPYLT